MGSHVSGDLRGLVSGLTPGRSGAVGLSISHLTVEFIVSERIFKKLKLLTFKLLIISYWLVSSSNILKFSQPDCNIMINIDIHPYVPLS